MRNIFSDGLSSIRRLMKRSKKDRGLIGSQRPLNQMSFYNTAFNNYDQEIPEYPIRDPDYARQLVQLSLSNYEVTQITNAIVRDVFASPDGSDRGWKIADTLADGETPVNPELKDIVLDLSYRKRGKNYIVGGNALKEYCYFSLIYGDTYGEIGISLNKGVLEVSALLRLPTWEMFNIEDDQGNLMAYHQKRYISEECPITTFDPYKIAHFSYQKRTLYGRSLYSGSLLAANNLSKNQRDLPELRRRASTNLLAHKFSPGTTSEQIANYRLALEDRQRGELITDIFLEPGDELESIHRVPGLLADAGRSSEISGQPSQNYKRFRYDVCSMMTEGLRQVIDVEIILKKGYDWFVKNGSYEIKWADWTDTSVGGAEIDDTDNLDANNRNLNNG